MAIVLETLSNRWLALFLSALALIELACFLLGGLISPNPNMVQTVSASICVDVRAPRSSRDPNYWFTAIDPTTRCKVFADTKDASERYQNLTADDVNFVFEFPLPRDGVRLKMSRWFQWMIGVMSLDIMYKADNKFQEGAVLHMDARLGGRMADSPQWVELGRTVSKDNSLSSQRPVFCQIQQEDPGWPYDCDLIPLFEQGSVYYDYYAVNLRMPETKEWKLGQLMGMTLHLIHPTGGFTAVFWGLKTGLFVLLLLCLMWSARRAYIAASVRGPRISLLQKMLLALGVAISILNLPVDWFSLVVNTPFMIFYSDVRQGAFYTFLMAFWLVFAGEHLMDSSDSRRRGSLFAYWRELAAVAVASVCLFAFDLAERGVHLADPFFSVWTSPKWSQGAMACIILAAIACVAYFVTLAVYVVRVLRNILAKRRALKEAAVAAGSSTTAALRNKRYSRLVFRFSFVMGLTLAAAGLSLAFFILGQVAESDWKWPSSTAESSSHSSSDSTAQDQNAYAPRLQYTAAFLTGVYGMWNLYVAALLVLYAPASPKAGISIVLARSETNSQVPLTGAGYDDDDSEAEDYNRTADGGAEALPLHEIPTEISVLSSFIQKPTEKLT